MFGVAPFLRHVAIFYTKKKSEKNSPFRTLKYVKILIFFTTDHLIQILPIFLSSLLRSGYDTLDFKSENFSKSFPPPSSVDANYASDFQ